MSNFKKNIFSQWGEDGILEEIFSVLKIDQGTCIEFGAWDGFHLANTAALWSKGWKGILIEGDSDKHKDLVKNIRDYNCSAYCYYVGSDKDNSLESILKRENIKDEIDLLSVDIDGDEILIFESLEDLKPKVLIFEYNPTLPFHVDIRSAQGNYSGCSGLALVNVGKAKGYFLIAVTDTNCIFVREDFRSKFVNFETDFRILANYKYCTYVITSYNGKYQIVGNPPYGLVEQDNETQIFINGTECTKVDLPLKPITQMHLSGDRGRFGKLMARLFGR